MRVSSPARGAVESAAMKPMLRAVNPANEEIVGEYPYHDEHEAQARIAAARAAFEQWRRLDFDRRAAVMRSVAAVLRRRRDELAALATREMGKTIASAEAEVDKCAAACEYFAANAAAMLENMPASSDASRSYVRFDPLGVVLAIMPWNFPFWQVFRFAAPNLMAGNTAVLKHASNVPGCALALEEVFGEAGLPSGAFAAVLVGGAQAERLIAHPAVAAVTLTGSEEAGRRVAAAAGAVLKKTVLELGGSDAFIVLGDVDIERTAREAAAARCINNGQSCIAAKRFIVDRRIAPQFAEALAAAMSALRVGDPMDRATDVGPLARKDLRDTLHAQVRRTVEAGAQVLAGGTPLPGRGYYYPPTVLAGVMPGMAAFDEETFGPVAAITPAADAFEAVRLANLSRYGLGASIWTADLELAARLAAEIESGCVFINGTVKSDPRLPFGGVKCSGWGRELSAFGIRELVNIKTVWIR